MDAEIKSFAASDGYRLHYRHWRPADAVPRGYVVALHGIQSHSGWYAFSSRRLAEAGYDVRFLDRRGSGLNAEPRGHTPHVARLLNDVFQFLGELVAERTAAAANCPVVLLGVSWGGKLAATCAAERPELVDAVALLSPGIRARIRPSRMQTALLGLAVCLGGGKRRVDIPLQDPRLFTGEAEWQEFIRTDGLGLRQATLSFLRAGLELDRMVESAPARLRQPLLLMLAGRDEIIDNAALRRWSDRLAAEQRTLVEYTDAAHTLEFEPHREQFVTDLIDWLNAFKT